MVYGVKYWQICIYNISLFEFLNGFLYNKSKYNKIHFYMENKLRMLKQI